MTYDTRERSAADGRPVDLYIFARGAGFVWRFTSADRPITFDFQTYIPQVINRGPIEQGSELTRSNQRLRVHRNFPIAALYKVAPPSDPIFLQLNQFHYGDTQAKQLWQGEVASVGFEGDEANIECVPLTGSLQSFGLRRNYQRTCPFVLYGNDCTLDPAAFRTTGAAAAISGLAITVLAADALADGYFDGGFIEWLIAPGTYERRFISSHVAATITVDVLPLGLEVGQEVRLYPGCDHSIATCNSKFGNALNYGGMPYIPLKNPMGSDPIF